LIFGIIFGVFFLLIIGGIIALLVILFGSRIKFDSFAAEMRMIYSHGHSVVEKDTVISSYRWTSEQFMDGTAFTKLYSDDYNDYVVTCHHLGSHDNCYTLSMSASQAFRVSYLHSKSRSKVDCPAIHNPTLPGSKRRDLSKCNMYKYETSSVKQEVWVDSENDYPVLITQVKYDEDGVIVLDMQIEYTSFTTDVKEDDNTFKPYTTKIYDFRQGSSSKLMASVSRLYSWAKTLFANDKNIMDLSAVDAFSKRSKDQRDFWKLLNKVPLDYMPGPVSESSAPKTTKTRDIGLPQTFDARDHWSSCRGIIGSISDQKSCGSCWAMATAAVFSDRVCIGSFVPKLRYSPQFMVDCYMNQLGCSGGFAPTLWKDISVQGMVPETCVPFVARDEECPTTCEDGTPINSLTKIKVTNPISPWGNTDESREAAIQQEIYNHGPVAATMLVFDDLYKLSGSIYTRSSKAEFVGGHAVRIIGWGSEGDKKYWIVANSWGSDWNEHGFFRISRGNNECNIEEVVTAATPTY